MQNQRRLGLFLRPCAQVFRLGGEVRDRHRGRAPGGVHRAQAVAGGRHQRQVQSADKVVGAVGNRPPGASDQQPSAVPGTADGPLQVVGGGCGHKVQIDDRQRPERSCVGVQKVGGCRPGREIGHGDGCGRWHLSDLPPPNGRRPRIWRDGAVRPAPSTRRFAVTLLGPAAR